MVKRLEDKPSEKNKIRCLNYKEPNKWIKVEDNKIFKIFYKKIKSVDITYTYEKLGKEIGISKKSFDGIINLGNNIRKKHFNNFKNLVKKKLGSQTLIQMFGFDDIPHRVLIGIGGHEKIKLKENEITAEFICIMLGDGRLSKNGKTVRITLNGVDEKQYVDYIINKILKKLFRNIKFYISYDKGFPEKAKGLWIENRIKAVHNAILEKGKRFRDNNNGLIAGDKIENQVGVPDWIILDKTNGKQLIKGGLKGLFDTDGSISITSNGSLSLRFFNESLNLVKDYQDMCKKLNILALVSSKNKICGIYRKDHVERFLDFVKPEKFKDPNRLMWLGSKLILHNAPKKVRVSVKTEIENFLTKKDKKRFDYSIKNMVFLKNLLEEYLNKNNVNCLYSLKFNGQITTEMTDLAIKTALIKRKKNSKPIRYFSFQK